MNIQTIEIKDSLILHKPSLYAFNREGLHFFVDAQAPNWIALDSRGARLLSWVDGKTSLGQLAQLYAGLYEVDLGKAWLHARTFVQEALAKGILSLEPVKADTYKGRQHYLKPQGLKEFWIHLTQTCNLSCSHCLVSSNPKGEKGPEIEFYKKIASQSSSLGVKRFYVTGGEPFARTDIFDLIGYITGPLDCELILLTNATLIEGERLKKLEALDRKKIKFQVSLDGTTAKTNDAIRGKGVFDRASQGLKSLAALGFDVSFTAAVTKTNLKELEDLPQLAKNLGAKSVHLMWLHNRGRVLETQEKSFFPDNAELMALAREVKQQADSLGIIFDNYESIKSRVNGQPGVKYDLSGLCWESLCLYVDGHVYPSAAMAGFPLLSLGDARKESLRNLWLDSPVAKKFRKASVAQAKNFQNDPFKFLTGGGDLEHSYFFSSNGKEGSLVGHDPYYKLYVELMKNIMSKLGQAKQKSFNTKSGFSSPVILHAMGDDSIACSEDAKDWLDLQKTPVRTLHSNCVLAFDVEKPYRIVQQFYGKAADKPQADLCCPIKYADSEISHIPQEVIDRFYGCGSPITQAQVRLGETALDLGSGAGIDVFIAAKKVGSQGKAIGVDMTDQMLGVARECQKTVAQNLGFDAVEFKKGYLESIPVENQSVDLVTSNCVINLSPNKPKVFAEMWRILKDHGRAVAADIVSDEPVPLNLQAHKDLWGECISGSLSEAEFVAGLEKAGFYGISVLKKTFWKEVEGHKFYSVTVRGYKFEKKAGCRFIGQKAIYLGPYKATVDEEGHVFPRNEAIEVCTDTAAKLSAAPYAGQFRILEPDGAGILPIPMAEESCCATGAPGGCC
ncbi:MAG: methyltransferase domain-containing protein [Elusimicrobia bacterium]|nr:methyltransferase domain-containing protein [Elusimicrobiota bacterium]